MMSETSIAQTPTGGADETRTTWYFTFGASHRHPTTDENLANAYVLITGTYPEARQKMIAAFGTKWSHQYATAQLAGVERWNLRQVEMPPLADMLDAVESKIWACPKPECGYHIADDPVADGDVSTAVLISEHLEEHALDAQYPAEVEPSTVETVDAEVMPGPKPDPERAGFTQGLRELACWLDAHPEVPLPYLGDGGVPGDTPALSIYVHSWEGDARGRMATILRAMGRADKVVNDIGAKGRMNLVRQFAGIRVVASAERDEVCRRVVVGSHEVEVEVPDPAVVQTVPLVKVKKVVEEVRWECPPLLAEPVQIAASRVAVSA